MKIRSPINNNGGYSYSGSLAACTLGGLLGAAIWWGGAAIISSMSNNTGDIPQPENATQRLVREIDAKKPLKKW